MLASMLNQLIVWNHRVLFCMTVPHQRVDAFWQTLFHELGHILNSHLGVVRYVDFDSAQGRHETFADEFARDTLILPGIYRRFLESTRNITWGDVVSLAQMADVLPCIALARLQHDGLLDWTDYPDKVMKYPWA